MADEKKIVVPNIETSSRFAVFETEDTDSSEDNSGKKNVQDSKKANKNAKKRARKKKKAAAQTALTNDLRNMAFGKQPPGIKPKDQSCKDNKKNDNPLKLSVSHKEEEKPPSSLKDNFESWIEIDEQIVLNKFQKDLQEALQISVTEEEERNKAVLESMQARRQKKENLVKLSLDEFQNAPVKQSTANGHKSEILPEYDITEGWRTEQQPNIEVKQEKEKKKKKKHASKNHQNIESAFEDKQKDPKKQIEVIDVDGLHAANLAQWKSDLDSKDKENEQLKLNIEQLKYELAQVKKRNKQLCFILGQGEMKDKSEILLQIEDLTSVKDELSTELKEMHSALEQERSKVSSLKLELAKYQNGAGRTKKHSSCEPEV